MQVLQVPDSVAKIEKYVLEYPFVKEVYYQESLLFLINENVKKDQFVSSCNKYIPLSHCTDNH